MLLDLNKIVLSIDGRPMRPTAIVDGKEVILENEEIYLSQQLGVALYSITGVEDSLKYKSMGETLYREGALTVDESDLSKIEDFVKAQSKWPAYLKGPIEAAIRHARNKGVADS